MSRATAAAAAVVLCFALVSVSAKPHLIQGSAGSEGDLTHPSQLVINPQQAMEGRTEKPAAADKMVWPELVGRDADEAKALLEAETGKNVYLVSQGSMVTMDFRTDRIRVWYDSATHKVTAPPKVG